MLFRPSRFWPLAMLLLSPLLAQADPLNNGVLGLVAYFSLGLLVLAVGTTALTSWAYRRPDARGVYWAQFLPLLLCLILGVWLDRSFNGGNLPLLGNLNPLLSVCLPLAAWLNGVTLARRATAETPRQVWVGVAALGLVQLLLVLPRFYLQRHLFDGGEGALPLQSAYQLLTIVLGIASWAIVVRQVAHPSLWQPVWRTPAIGAAVGAGFFIVHMAYFFWQLPVGIQPDFLTPIGFGWGVLRSAGLTWVQGVLALLATKMPKSGPAVV